MGYPVFASGDVLTAADMNAVGLWKIGDYNLTTTTNGFNSVFSSNYDHYKLVFSNITATAGTQVTMKMRASGTATSVNYYSALSYVQWNGTSTPQTVNNGAAWYLTYTTGSTGPGNGVMELLNPFKASVRVSFGWTGMFWDAGTAGGGTNTNTTQFDGFEIIGTSTLSGTISVYGYNK